jgi:hypothetical protein
MRSSSLGTVVVAVSTVAVVVGMVVAGIGGWAASAASSTALDTLDLTVDALAAADEGVAVAAGSVDAVAGVLDEAGATLFAAGVALADAAPLVDEAAETLGTDVAGAIDSALETLPALIEVGGIVDNALGAIGFITGNRYEPDVPLDEALVDLQTALAPIPDQLREQADQLSEANESTMAIAEGLQETAVEVVEVRRALEDASDVLAGYQTTTADALALAEDVGDDIRALRIPVVVAVVLVGLLLATTQLVPLLVGLGLRGAGPLDHLGDDEADQPDAEADGVEDDLPVPEVEPEGLGDESDG